MCDGCRTARTRRTHHAHAHTHTENYAEHERQKETYEEQLMVARERLEEVNREANKLRKQRDVTLEAHLRKIRQLEIQKKTLQVALFSLAACVSCVCVVLVLTLGICEQEELEIMAAEPEVTSVACEVEPPAQYSQSLARQATTPRSRERPPSPFVRCCFPRLLMLVRHDTGAEHSLDMKQLAQHDNITKFHIISHTHWDR